MSPTTAPSHFAENSTSAKGHISPDLYLGQCSTLLTSSFIDSFFHSLTFHSLLYSSDPSFVSLINNRWDTAWFPQTLEKLSVASSATQFWNMSKMFLFLLPTTSKKESPIVYVNFLLQMADTINSHLIHACHSSGLSHAHHVGYTTGRHDISSVPSFVYCEKQYRHTDKLLEKV